MADYTLNVTGVTDVQVAAAQHQMDLDNAARTESGLPTFATLKEFLEHTIKAGFLTSWENVYEDYLEKSQNLKEKFALADQATKDQIIALLNP